jgi:alpha-D-xyloside xylohydrolase
VRVYAGASGDFALYQDDGKTYAYEKGDYRITHLRWDDGTHKLSQEGAPAWTVPDAEILEVIGH